MSDPRPEHIAEVLQRYARFMSASDVEGILGLFAPNAVLRDPITGPERSGHDEIRAWFEKSFARNTKGIDMRLDGPVRVAGKYGAAALTAIAGDGTNAVRIDTLDVMAFDAAGLVVRLDAYWGPSNIHQVNP